MMDTTDGKLEDVLPLPQEKLPKCWWNHEELSYFFSPFRSQIQNPLDKENKIKFWKPLIRTWCDCNNRCSFTLFEIEHVFQKGRLVPACLPGVLEEMLRNGELRLKSEFMQIPQQTWSGWALDVLVKKPVVWSFQRAKDLVVATKGEEETVYIHVGATKSQAEAVLAMVHESDKGYLFAFDELEQLCKEKGLTTEVDVAIHWLLRQGLVSTAVVEGTILVKFAEKHKKASNVTELDRTAHSLRYTEKVLITQMEKLEVEKLETIQTAKAYLAKGMRQMARSCLRKKQKLEKCAEKRASALDNVQMMLSHLNEAQADSTILKSYQNAVNALKSTFKEGNLTEDTVSNTMNQVQEMLDVHDEIQDALSMSVSSTGDEDLETELAELLLADVTTPEKLPETPTREQLGVLAGLPSPPSSELSLPSPPTSELSFSRGSKTIISPVKQPGF
ncbi:charged multivesicular body protein 7 [Anabrus simplex]|uniref:charged multivesicular body protein 7 n=1 Tax=Anabrus simplex TaxID=316456 RepID=UPI0035A33580